MAEKADFLFFLFLYRLSGLHNDFHTKASPHLLFLTKTSKTSCCDAWAAPFVSSPAPACSEASFGKPVPEKKQPSCLRLASQQGKPSKQAGAMIGVVKFNSLLILFLILLIA